MSLFTSDEQERAVVRLVEERIARWLEWRSGSSVYAKDGTPLPPHPRASASGWGEAGMKLAAAEILLSLWRVELPE